MEDNQSFLDLQVDEDAGTQLTETSRWAKLLAIIVLSFSGVFALILFALWGRLEYIMGTTYDVLDSRNINVMKIVIVICFVIFLVIVLILMIFLLRGAKALKAGIQKKDQALFNTGLGHFRNYLAMMGVLGLIGLVFKLLGFLVK